MLWEWATHAETIYHAIGDRRLTIGLWALIGLWLSYATLRELGGTDKIWDDGGTNKPLDETDHSGKMLWTGPQGHGTEAEGGVPREYGPPEYDPSPGSPQTNRYIIKLLDPPCYAARYYHWTLDRTKAQTFEFLTAARLAAEFDRSLDPDTYIIEQIAPEDLTVRLGRDR